MPRTHKRWRLHPVWPHIAWDGARIWRRRGKLTTPMKCEVWDEARVVLNNSVSAQQIFVFKKPYNVGRVVRECATGKPMPRGAWTDHIDGDFTNNDPKNIRWVTPGGNCRHRVGAARVRRSPHGGPSWIAYGSRGGKYRHLGAFATQRAAKAAAQSFSNKLLAKEIIHG